MTHTPTALVVRGGWEGHAPVAATDAFLPFLDAHGFDVRVEDSPAVYADRDTMTGVDLVVQCVTMATITRDQLDGLTTTVAGGAGLVGWHGGIADSYRDEVGYAHLVGGQFVTHPAQEPSALTGEESDNFLDYRVEFTPLGRAHPVTSGLDDFDLTSEQYWVLHDDLIDVLATTTHPARTWQPWSRPVVSPAIWTRGWGRGRIVVVTPGHSLDVLEHPTVRTAIERGMLWASRTASES